MTRLVKGIILRKQDYRESDRLFVIYTDELGKIEAVAKGVRKIKSKMAGHLELFSIVNLMVAPGKNYYQIAGAERGEIVVHGSEILQGKPCPGENVHLLYYNICLC